MFPTKVKLNVVRVMNYFNLCTLYCAVYSNLPARKVNEALGCCDLRYHFETDMLFLS